MFSLTTEADPVRFALQWDPDARRIRSNVVAHCPGNSDRHASLRRIPSLRRNWLARTQIDRASEVCKAGDNGKLVFSEWFAGVAGLVAEGGADRADQN